MRHEQTDPKTPQDRSKRHRVTTAGDLALISSPARQEIVDGLQAYGPTSVAELGAVLGRAPDSLYYHLKKLVRAGLVMECGVQGEGPRAEVLYDTPGELVIDFQPNTARERSVLLKTVGSAVRAAERDLLAALESGRAIYRRIKSRNAWVARSKGWLTPDELAEVRTHLDAASTILARGSTRSGKGRQSPQLHSLTFVLTPVEATERSKRD